MSRNRKKSKKPAPKRVITNNQYTSKCCGVPAKKPALQALSNWKDAKLTEFGGLGKFRCTQCGKRCAVNRSKINEEPAA